MATVQQKDPVAISALPDALPYELPRKGIAKFLHRIVISILNRLPKKAAQFLFVLGSKASQETHEVFKGAATFRALEVMYMFPRNREKGETTFSGRIWWALLDNARSIWNRLLVVKQELRTSIQEVLSREKRVRLLSIGSGSARPVLETLAELQLPVEVMLLDQDQDAVTFSRNLADRLGLNGTIELVLGNFLKVKRHCKEFKPHIVEMEGLLDYLEDKLAILLLKEVFRILEPGGWLITGNIAPNHERRFVERGINWLPMHHRTEIQLRNLLCQAGFEEPRIRWEPLGIHMVAVVRKPG